MFVLLNKTCCVSAPAQSLNKINEGIFSGLKLTEAQHRAKMRIRFLFLLVPLLFLVHIVSSETCVYKSEDTKIDPKKASSWDCDGNSTIPNAYTDVVITEGTKANTLTLSSDMECYSLSLLGILSISLDLNVSLTVGSNFEIQENCEFNFQSGRSIQADRMNNRGSISFSSNNSIAISYLNNLGKAKFFVNNPIEFSAQNVLYNYGTLSFIFNTNGGNVIRMEGKLYNYNQLYLLPQVRISSASWEGIQGSVSNVDGYYSVKLLESFPFQMNHNIKFESVNTTVVGDTFSFSSSSWRRSKWVISKAVFSDQVYLSSTTFFGDLRFESGEKRGKALIQGKIECTTFKGFKYDFSFQNSTTLSASSSVNCADCSFIGISNARIKLASLYFGFRNNTVMKGNVEVQATLVSSFEDIQVDNGYSLSIYGNWIIKGHANGRGKIVNSVGSIEPKSGSKWTIDHFTCKDLIFRFNSPTDYQDDPFLSIDNDFIVAIGRIQVFPYSAVDFLKYPTSMLLTAKILEVANPDYPPTAPGVCSNVTIVVKPDRITLNNNPPAGVPVKVYETADSLTMVTEPSRFPCFSIKGFWIKAQGKTFWAPTFTNGTTMIDNPRNPCKNGEVKVKSMSAVSGYNVTVNGTEWISPWTWPTNVANADPIMEFVAFSSYNPNTENFHAGINWNSTSVMEKNEICGKRPYNFTISASHRGAITDKFEVSTESNRFELPSPLRICDSVQFLTRLDYVINGTQSSSHWSSESKVVANYPIQLNIPPVLSAGGTVWTPSVIFNFTKSADWCARCPSLRTDFGMRVRNPSSGEVAEFFKSKVFEYQLGSTSPEYFEMVPLCRSYNMLVYNGTAETIEAPPRPKNIVHFEWSIAFGVAIALSIVFFAFFVVTVKRTMEQWRDWQVMGSAGFVDLP
eukprot:TRINITY_DN6719_c0_g1_i1.p1 TRINITY_DN6719_c0_g1~~TRINITY_DN6719_c0_g1_i1.p1  ORF type:complete len:910 (+),score=201.73 TRINITY_DN6719_c0_g1_i1:73-2802(+)